MEYKKCLNCGSNSLVEGNFPRDGWTAFRVLPKIKPSLWGWDLIQPNGYICLECGFVGLFADLEEVKKIVAKKNRILEAVVFLCAFVSLLMNGCSEISTTPLPISDENQYFENEQFSVYYPKEWSVTLRDNGSLLFGNYNYRPYSFMVDIDEDKQTVEDIRNNRPIAEIVEGPKKSIKKMGFDNISCEYHNSVFDGKEAENGLCRGTKSNKYREDRWIMVAIDTDKRVGQVYIRSYPIIVR